MEGSNEPARPQHGATLREAANEASGGGKRVRPRLLLATYDALAGPGSPEPREVAAVLADAVEMLHTAFLAHDDVIDDDQTRRGRPNVAGVYAASARESGAPATAAHGYGAAAGLLAGDLALASAFRDVALCGATTATTARLLDLFDDSLLVTAEGELRDVWHSIHRSAELDDVLVTAELKTAAYSFGLPLRVAALLAGRDDLDEPLSRLGRSLGVAFQLRDDVLGTFGDPAVTGKPVTSDLRAGRCTALVAFARTTSAWTRIAPLLGRPDVDEDDLERVRELLEACGARQETEDLAARFELEAVELAEQVGLAELVEHVLALGDASGRRDDATRAA
ncbi:polyprenyl synthetase family protein [Isoptericola aurantiacus]|uniref:polyprenyl synthetase family protein n=1 Tax=Isoptericola aurantiacus TaxID=3377839 RepID=UPI00383A55A3